MKLMSQKENQCAAERPKTQEFKVPAVNIFETQDGYVLEAELPGVNKNGLEVTLEGTELTLVGHRADAGLPGTPIFREGSTTDFRRVFELDPAIDTSRISAKVDQGILTLTLPKSEEVKPRRVVVD